MRHEVIQRRVGLLLLFLTGAALLSVLVDRLLFRHFAVHQLLLDISFVGDSLTFCLLTVLTFWNHRYARWAMSTLIFVLSAPVILSSGSRSFFGLATVLMASLLFLRFGMLERWFLAKSIGILIWTCGFILMADRMEGLVSVSTSLSTFAFLLVSVAFFYFLFEEEIRELLAANKQKDAEIAEKDAEIERLVPLSTLGERVAHVAHSFKNNLGLLGTAQFHLDHGGDPRKASEKIDEFSRSMNERIENILMVSRAGADRKEELFDASRVLAGLNQVYLTEPAFLQRAKVVLDAVASTPVVAVRWDFLLMVENILKNALEALTSKGGYGNIQVTLAERTLRIANDGGAMVLCQDCRSDCLKCTRYGRPGQTTKAGGTGHGLAQVFSTCRKYGWTLRIRTHEDWTIFEIGLTLRERPTEVLAPS